MINISGKTKLLGVIADPIKHVMAPELFNPVLSQLKKDIVVVPLHIKTRQLKQAYDGLISLNNLIGILITVPHKETILEYIDKLENEAKFCSCVNIVKFCSGVSYGQTFDGIGFVNGLRKVHGGDILKSKRVLVLGAGGAAMAISYSLIKAGIKSLTIKNRNQDRAKNLITKLNKKSNISSLYEKGLYREGNEFDIIINATTLGLEATDPLPYDIKKISEQTLVVDIIMKPHETNFLKFAKQKGAQVHYGIEMLLGQQEEIIRFLDI